MKKLYFVWIVVLIILVIISLQYKGESTGFYGIADAREVVINSGNPVEIKKIHVVQGQSIKEGDTLVELSRPELDMKINEITNQLRQTKKQTSAKVNSIKAQIKELQAQYERNKKLTAELKSVKKENPSTVQDNSQHPILIKIENLKRELRLAASPAQIKNELNLLMEEKGKLTIFAQINGIIGSVNAKEGEKVSPFTPIITLHTKSPSYIKGYIHEDVYNKVTIGQEVTIASLSDINNTIEGEVVGVGSRIVEYPVRLRKGPDFQIWGREIIIKIPHDNILLLGEKVRISYSRF
jgi:multidrug resistance efflux pump